jgi:TatD DNase family protein
LAPAQCSEVVQHLSRAWGVSVEAAADQVVKNLRELVSL